MSASISHRAISQDSKPRAFAFWFAYLLASFAIIASYASIFRPMWIDEAIHFVLSGQPTLGDLLLRLHNPDAGFLTRQTGFYQVINYLTFQVTGANWVALRAPSIASGVLMIWALYIFLRERGASRTFQFVGLIALAGQAGFMYYVGEARPYFPYAATTLGVLAFFTANEQSQRTSSVKLLGWVSIILGALFHLYFLLVLPIVLAYSLWYQFFRTNTRPNRTTVARVCHPWLVSSSVILALALGWLTWMRPQATNQLDAFAWTGGSLTSLADTVIGFHLEFLAASALRTSFMLIEVGLVLFLLVSKKYRQHRELFASAVLIFAAVGTTGIIAAASVANNYAIANRQLVVGPLMIAGAFTWQLFVCANSGRRIRLTRVNLAAGGALGLLYGGLLMELNLRIPTVPLSLLISTNAFLLLLVATVNSNLWNNQRRGISVFLLSALGLMVTALSVTTRVSPHWQLVVAGTVGLVLLGLGCIWMRLGKALELSTVVTAVVLAAFSASAFSIAGNRSLVVKSEYSTRSALQAEIHDLGPLGISRLKGLDERDLLNMKSNQGWSGMVYLSNINAVEGGPVWPILGSL